MTKIRALGAALIALLIAPAAASAAEAEKIGANEKVTQAMFVLIFALIAILAIVAIWEAKRGDH